MCVGFNFLPLIYHNPSVYFAVTNSLRVLFLITSIFSSISKVYICDTNLILVSNNSHNQTEKGYTFFLIPSDSDMTFMNANTDIGDSNYSPSR